MGDVGLLLNGLFEDTPLLGRVFFVSVELCLLAPLLALAIKVGLLKTYRLQSLLWFFLLLNVLVGVLMRAPMDITLWRNELPTVPTVVATPENVFRPQLRERVRQADGPVVTEGVLRDISTPMTPPPGIAPPTVRASSLPHWWASLTVFHGFGLCWALGVLTMLSLLGVERIRLTRLLQRTVAPSDALLAQFQAEADRMRMVWKPVLRVTCDLETPAIVGILRPVILVPQWLEKEGTKEQWAWTLRHELTHWRHGDTLAQMLRLVVQAVFFFHPVVWWAGKRWEEAAELACDRSLLRDEQDAVGYAQELCELLGMIGKRKRPLMSTGLFASRSHIGRRIETLLRDPLALPGRLGTGRRILACLVLIAMLGVEFRSATSSVTPLSPVLNQVLSGAAEGETLGRRVLQFPEDYAIGTVSVGQESFDARGAVPIPEGATVSLRINDAGAADLSALSTFGPNDIQSISMSRTMVQDEQLVHLQGLTGLQRLAMEETAIGDAGMQYLANLTQLTQLNIDSTLVGDGGMAYVASMTRMQDLELNRSLVGDVGLSYIRDMKELTHLDMWMLDITDEGMQYLAGLEKLYALGLEDTLITDEGLKYLEGLPNLQRMNLENNNITDAGLASLVKIPRLAEISLADTYLTDAGMALLATAPHLQAAILPIQISPEGLKALEGTPVGHYAASHRGNRKVEVAISGENRPLPQAHFLLVEELGPGDEEVHVYRTDANGKATLYLPNRSTPYRLRAFAEGYVTNEAAWSAPAPAVLSLNLEAASRMGGQVVDGRGRPVAGVSVSIPVLGGHNWDSSEALPHAVVTDDGGRWTCDVVPTELVDFWVSLDHRDFATTTYSQADLPLAALRNGTAVLAIADPIGLPGRVVDGNGAPVEGARVTELERWRQRGVRATGRAAVSDEAGAFEIKPIRPGETILKVEAPGYVPHSPSVNVEADMAPLEIVLESAGALRGKAVTAAKEPLAGLLVWASVMADNGVRLGSWHGETDGEGRFAWTEVPKGVVSLYFRQGDEQHRVEAVAISDVEQEFVLPFASINTEGLEAGRALLSRFNAAHRERAVGAVQFSMQVREFFQEGEAPTVRRYEVARSGDGRYREVVRFGEEGDEKLPWRHAWDGTMSMRHGHPAPGGEEAADPALYTIGREFLEPSHLVALDWYLHFVRDHSPTERFEVMTYKEKVLTLGEDGVVGMKLWFSDPEKLHVERAVYFDEEGGEVFSVQVQEWFEHKGVVFPMVAEGTYNYPLFKGRAQLTLTPFESVDTQNEAFLLDLDPGGATKLHDVATEQTVAVAALDARLIAENRYQEALSRYGATE